MVKNLPANAGDLRDSGSWVGKIPWRRKWQPTTVSLPGKSHGQRSLAGYSSWGHKESDMPEHTHIVYTRRILFPPRWLSSYSCVVFLVLGKFSSFDF